MTLDANEKVYQADQMHITPASDGQIYGYTGSWVINGLGLDYQSSSATLQPGTAILQGRLYELNAAKTISLTGLTQPIYIGLSADLTQVNTGGGLVVNNQYTMLAQSTKAFGDLTEGDLQAFIPIYMIAGGIVSQIVFNHDEVLTVNPDSSYFSSAGKAKPVTFLRSGCSVTLSYDAKDAINKNWNNDFSILSTGHVPLSMRPVSTTTIYGGYGIYGTLGGAGNYNWTSGGVGLSSDGWLQARAAHNEDKLIVLPGSVGSGTVSFGLSFTDPGLGNYYKQA